MSSSLSGGQVTLGIVGDASNFSKSVESGVAAEEGFFGGLGRKVGGLILTGFAALGIGTAIGEYVKSGIEEYQAFDAMNAQFSASLAAGGKAAGLTKQGMDELAISVAGYSGQAVSSIGKTEQILSGFHAIKNTKTDKVFDDTTRAAANLAAHFGGDASSSALKLGRALSDPVKGMTALRRVGVTFTEGQQKAIKAMVESGNVLGAQKAILAQVHAVTGDAAKDFGNTLPGAIARTKVAVGELNRNLVTAFLPVLTPIINSLADKINAVVIPAVEGLTTKIRDDAVPRFKDMAKVVGEVLSVLTGAKINIGPWTQPLQMIGSAFRSIFGAIHDNTGKVLGEFGQGALHLGIALAPVVTAVLKFLGAVSPLGAVLKGFGPVLPSIIGLLSSLAASLSGVLIKALTALTPSLSQLALVLSSTVTSVLRALLPVITDLAKALSSMLTKNQGALTTFVILLVNVATAILTWLKPILSSKLAIELLVGALVAWKAISLAQSITASTVALYKGIAAWVATKISMGETLVLQAMYAKEAVVNGAKAALAWVLQTAKLVAHIVVMGALKVATGVATAAQWLFNAAMDANPIGLIILAVVALVAALVWFFTQTKLGKEIWQNIVTFLTQAWNNLLAVGKVVFNAIGSVVTVVFNAIKTVIQVVLVTILTIIILYLGIWKAIFTVAFNVIKAVVTVVFNAVKAVIEGVIRFLSPLINANVKLWQTVFTTVFNAVKAVVTNVINAVKAVIQAVVNFLTPYFKVQLRLWQTVFTTVFNAVKAVVTNVINAVKAVIRTVISWISTYWRVQVTLWRTIITTVFNAIRSVVTNVINAVRSFISGAVSTIRGLWTSAWNAILSTIQSVLGRLWSAVTSTVGKVISFFGGIGGKIIGAIGNAGRMLFTVGQNIIQGLMNGIMGMAKNVIGSVTNVVGGAINAAKSLLGINSPSKVFRAFGDAVGVGLHQGIDRTHSRVKASAEGLAKTVTTSFAGVASGLVGKLSTSIKVSNGLPSLGSIPASPVALDSMPSSSVLHSVAAGGGPAPIVNQFNGHMGYTKDEIVENIVVRQRRAQQKVRVPR